MQTMRKSKLVESRLSLVALLTTVLVSFGSASAKEHKVKTSENEAHVVAHISFTGLSAVDMAMQRKVNDKYYLYVLHSKDQGISIVDITKPGQAKAVGVIPWPDATVSSSRAKVHGSGQVAAGRAKFYLCVESRWIMGGVRAGGSSAGTDGTLDI